MQKKIPGLLVAIIIFVFNARAQVVADTSATVSPQMDTTSEDMTSRFFENAEKIQFPGKTFLLTRAGKTLTLSAFLKSADMESAQQAVADLDGDGKRELLISSYTGGAHCCDEIYIYRNTAPNKYQQVAKLFAGHTVITAGNEFDFSFYEQFGYFFTCYACAYTDTTDEAPIPLRSIRLVYTKNKLVVTPGDQELRSSINDNLGKLSEQPYLPINKDLGMDEGLRKEFAMNLAVFYYSFGRNIVETQKLFNKYYKFPDAKKVWYEFNQTLLTIKKDNFF